jgi:hypothetical protein
MKIGVVTTQYASNYGALLQTYALQKYLNEQLKQNSEVLAYYPAHFKDYWKILPKVYSVKTFVLCALRCLMPRRVFKQKKRYEQMLSFVQKSIPCSKPYYSKEEIEAEKCPYDVLICGSDQIWNVSRHNKLQEVWFLDLSGNGWEKPIRVAYAPSVASEIPESLKPEVADKLSSFSAVSVRESSDIKQIESLYNKRVYHVCDPVLLSSEAQWRNMAIKPKISGQYILCYFLNPSKEDRNVVEEVKKKTELPVVLIDINDINKIPTDVDVLDASPEEFVGWFDNASYVITNSFHGTAFSVLFKKNFLVLKKNKANSRMDSLLNRIGLSSRMVSLAQVKQMTRKELETDYSESEPALKLYIEESKKFLKDALGV